MRILLATLLTLLAFSGLANAQAGGGQGPSFDCARARTPVERSICGRPMLAALDLRLAQLQAAEPRTQQSIAEQRAWLSRRDSCARSQTLDWLAACVEAAYRDRIAKLEFGDRGTSPESVEPPSGPSFDCRRAEGPIETAICADPTLTALDVQLSDAFGRQGQRDPSLAADQQRWIGERDACIRYPPTLMLCVADAYRRRIEELR